MGNSDVVLLGGASLTCAGVDAVARRGARVEVEPAAARRAAASHGFLLRLTEENFPIYGLTTGCGPLAAHGIDAGQREDFQRNLVRSHANTLGAAHPVEFVRAAMVLRAHCFAQGRSGVDPALIELLRGMLNAGIHPVVREVGGCGASGDLVELAQIALAALGEAEVEYDGAVVPAAQALRRAGLQPLVPRHREGLALMNGTSFHTGAAAVLLCRAERCARAARVAAAMSFEALCGNLQALDAELQNVRPHPGQKAVADALRALVAGSELVRNGRSPAASQDAYTVRCIPQVLGAAHDTQAAAARVVEIEINSVCDNPIFLADEGRVVHGGNFHGQPVAMALDQLKLAATEIALAAERRIARLLDPALNNGLPAFLVRGTPGLENGFMGLQYCASHMAADNAVLVTPASVRSLPTNANNQDIVGMGMVAARQARRVLDNLEQIVAIELLCAAQALDIRGVERAGQGTRAAHSVVRRHVAPLVTDRSLAADVRAVCELIERDAW